MSNGFSAAGLKNRFSNGNKNIHVKRISHSAVSKAAGKRGNFKVKVKSPAYRRGEDVSYPSVWELNKGAIA